MVARSLLEAGAAALTAGSADAGVETLRRAAEEATRAQDPALSTTVLTALGSALVHAVRGSDGEGAVVLHRALATARTGTDARATAEILRELAFVDVQAGRHTSAERHLRDAGRVARPLEDDALAAGILAVRGMNEADRGRHASAAVTLAESARLADRTGSPRQQAWSLSVLSRSLLLNGRLSAAREAAEASIEVARQARWNAFVPWPQSLRAEVLAEMGQWDGARRDAEVSFALACEIGDPCWEGMAGRPVGLLTAYGGNREAGRAWLEDARRRCDRVSDRYVWVSAYIGLAQLQLAGLDGPASAGQAAETLRTEALGSDLPEFVAWASPTKPSRAIAPAYRSRALRRGRSPIRNCRPGSPR